VHGAFYILYIIQCYFVYFVQLHPSNYILAINTFMLYRIRIDVVYFSTFSGLERTLETPCTVRSLFFISFYVALYILCHIVAINIPVSSLLKFWLQLRDTISLRASRLVSDGSCISLCAVQPFSLFGSFCIY